MTIENRFFYNLTRTKLSCGKNLIELTSYNNIILWWFADFTFHHYINELLIRGSDRKTSRLKLPLVFFYRKIEIFLTTLNLILLKFIMRIYEKREWSKESKKHKILFTSLEIDWRYIKDYENNRLTKSDAFFDSIIKNLKDKSEIIGVCTLGIFPLKGIKDL